MDVPNRSPKITVLLDVSVLTAPTRALLLSLDRVNLLFLSKNCAVEKFLMLWQNTYNVEVLNDVAKISGVVKFCKSLISQYLLIVIKSHV